MELCFRYNIRISTCWFLDTINTNKSFDSFNIGSFDNESKTVLEVTNLFLKTFNNKKY